MLVVLDTTETFADLRLEGPNFKLLHAYLRDTSSKLLVPHVVFEETINHFREKLREAVESCETSVQKIAKLTGEGTESVCQLSIDESSELLRFRAHLKARVEKLRGEVIECDALDVTMLVQRALQRRKPFDSEGRRGFRDAVLWETVLREVIEKGPAQAQVALLTRNTKDFGKDGTLADDLQEDCKQIGKPADCITLFNGLTAFIDVEVKPHLEKLEAIHIAIEEGRYKDFDPCEMFSDFHSTIRYEVGERLQRLDFGRVTRGTVGEFESPALHSLDKTCGEYEVVDVWSIEENQIAVGIAFYVHGEIECREVTYFDHPIGDEVFADWYHGEHVGDATFEVSMTIILDRESGEVEDFEVNDLDVTLGMRWPYRDYD